MELRKAHDNKNFDKIDYCKDCDFLYQDPEILIWSNDKTAKINHMLGTDENFILTDFPSFERSRIAGVKKVNEFRDGFLILISILRLLIFKK